MVNLSFQFSTVAAGALNDRFATCQSATWGIMIAIMILFVRDKRQMARVAAWSIGLSVIGTILSAYGVMDGISLSATPAMADFIVGLVLLGSGCVELYRHELLKSDPLSTKISEKFMKYARRSTLPILALFSSIAQIPCAIGPYSLIKEALITRPGQLIEGYFGMYLLMLYLPLMIIVLAWYGLLSIPGIDLLKSSYKNPVRLLVGITTIIIAIYLLWHTQAITLLPGLANIRS